jgi:hypothetical protein
MKLSDQLKFIAEQHINDTLGFGDVNLNPS